MSRQRIVGIWMAVAGVVAAIVAWFGVRAATNANDEAIYDAEINCLARSLVSGRSGPCDLPQTNSTPWVVLAIIGGVVFLAGIILTAASGRGSSTTTSPHHVVQLPGVPSQPAVQQSSVVNDRIRNFAQKDPDWPWAAPDAAYVNEANDSAAGVRESLELLEALLNDGLISDAEHASKRDRILDRL